MDDEDINLSDIPPLTDDQLAQAIRTPYLRPRAGEALVPLSAGVIVWFRQRYPKYQTAINTALRAYSESHDEDAEPEADHRKTA